jgi:hypothetical protein
MMPGLIVLTRAPRLPQRTASAITRSEFPRFEILIRLKRIGHFVELKEGKIEQLFDRCRGQRLVLFDGERGKAMPGLGCDDDASPTARDDVAELFQHECCAIQIHFEDRCR